MTDTSPHSRRAFVSATCAAALLSLARPRPARAQRRIHVAIYDARGVGADALAAADRAIQSAPDLRARHVSPEDVRAGALDDADVALFTGGRGSVQGRLLGELGRERVRARVAAGCGYVGICAGSYMALQPPPRDPDEPADDTEPHKLALVAGVHATADAWQRGIAPARLRPTDGSAIVELHYANGPLIAPLPTPGLEPYVALATYETDIASPRHGTLPGQMRGTDAIAAARHGQGRLLLFSPNPTLDPARDDLFLAALRWAASDDDEPPSFARVLLRS